MLTPDELKKVEVFNDTYNAMYLKDMSDEKIEKIKSTANPVQKQLINNLKKITNPDHPYNIEFIEGPLGVRKFKLEDSKKTIYLFGEVHRNTIGHCKSPKAVQFNDYLNILSRDSPAFFDVYVETPMLKETKNSVTSSSVMFQLVIYKMYKFQSMSFLDAYRTEQSPKMSPTTTGFMFRKIRQTFKRCLQPKIRLNATECKLLRFHNVDLRSSWDIEKVKVTKNVLFKEDVALHCLFGIFNTGVLEHKNEAQILNVVRRVNKDCPTILNCLQMLIANDNINIIDIFSTNKSFKKELDASYKKKEIERWLVKMANLIVGKVSVKSFINIIKNLISSIKNNTKFDFFYLNAEIRSIFLDLNALLLDAYCLSRVFKVHNLKKHVPTGEFQPEQSHNIIIYAGDTHSNNMAQFFYSIGLNHTYNYYNPTDTSCVNMKTPNTHKYVDKNLIKSPLKSPVNGSLKSPLKIPVNGFLKDPASPLKQLTLIQLRGMAKNLGCKGYLILNKTDLIALIVQTIATKKSPIKPQAQPPQPQVQFKPPQVQFKPPQPQVQFKPPQPQVQLQSSPLPSPSKLNKLTVVKLRDIAKKMKLVGYSKYKKDELINFIKAKLNK